MKVLKTVCGWALAAAMINTMPATAIAQLAPGAGAAPGAASLANNADVVAAERLFSAWADSVGATGTTTVAVPGTAAQCGTHSDGAVCVLITGRKVTTLNVPGATVPQAAALVPTFANIATVR